MHSTSRAAFAAIALSLAAPAARAQSPAPAPAGVPKLAYINLQAILGQAPGRADAESKFEKEMTGYRATVQAMGDSLNKLIAEYNKQEITLSPTAKEARQKTIRGKEEDYQKRARLLEQQAQQRQAELVQPIMDRIKLVIDDVRREDGYTIIFDAGAQGSGIVAADKNLDITDRVLARLRTVAATPLPAAKADSDSKRGGAKGAPAGAPAGVTKQKPSTQ
ncbi:MAG: hypothetical protein NVS1B4_19320 [Gemmatimonadaceae bacterium]